MAECVYAATFTMRNPEGKTVKDMFPTLFSDDEEPTAPSMTDEERQELVDLMSSINEDKRNKKPSQNKPNRIL